MRRRFLTVTAAAGISAGLLTAGRPAGFSVPTRDDRPEMVLQLGHATPVAAAAFSPDERSLVTGSDGIRIRGLGTGELQRTIPGDGSRLALSPDGRWIATVVDRNQVEFQNLRTGARRRIPGRPAGSDTGSVEKIAWSPDGRVLAVAGAGSSPIEGPTTSLKLWDARTGTLRRELDGHTGTVYAVAWSPDGRTLASAGHDESVVLWEARTGRLLWRLEEFQDEIRGLAFSPDGSLLASGTDAGEVVVIAPQSGRIVRRWKAVDGRVEAVFFSPNGKLLAVRRMRSASGLSPPDATTLWVAATGERHITLSGLAGLSFSPDSTTLAAGAADHSVALLDLASGARSTTLPGCPRHNVDSLAGSADGRLLAAGGWSVEGKRLTYTLWVWDSGTGRLMHRMADLPHSFESLAFAPRAPVLAIAGHTSRFDPRTNLTGSCVTVDLWEVVPGGTPRLLRTLTGPEGAAKSVAFSSDGRRVASGSDYESGTANVWNAESGELLRSLRDPTRGTIWSLAFNPSGELLATAGGLADYEVRLWQVASGKLQRMLQDRGSFVALAVAFSPDGTTLASGGDQGTTLWDMGTGARRRTLGPRGEAVSALAFSPGGRLLACAGDFEGIRIWDWRSGSRRAALLDRAYGTANPCFLTDGRRLATSGSNGTIDLWDVPRKRLLATSCLLPDGGFLVFTPDGYYDGSPNSEQFIRWRMGDRLLPASAFAAAYRQPDRVRAALQSPP